MKLVIILLFASLLQIVIARSIVKRDCNSNCCCTSNCNDCCRSSCQSSSSCNNCCKSDSNCGSCCNSRCSSCQGCQSSCKESCSSDCGTTEKVPVLVPFPPFSAQNNTNVYNFTANITLTNIINTVNNISIPITLNNTNINKITVDPPLGNTNVENTENRTCCIVVYPRTCNQSGCYVVTRRECSAICTGEIVTVTVTDPYPINPPINPWCAYYGISAGCPSPIPVAPIASPPAICPQWNAYSSTYLPGCAQQSSSSGCAQQPFISGCAQQQNITPVQNCQLAGGYPYEYCRNYQTQNCQGCYFCNGRYNPQECFSNPQCPLPCRIRQQ